VSKLKEALRSTRPHSSREATAQADSGESDAEQSGSGEEGEVQFGFFGEAAYEDGSSVADMGTAKYLRTVAEAEAIERAHQLLKFMPNIQSEAEKNAFIAAHVHHELKKTKKKGGRGGHGPASAGARPPQPGGFA
jgi:hypothetical protein